MRLLPRFLEKIAILLDVSTSSRKSFLYYSSVTLEKMKLLLFKRSCLSKHVVTKLPFYFAILYIVLITH